MALLSFQRNFILQIYDNPAGTSRAYLSMPRKNGKSALIAALALAHIAGPVAVRNSQIIAGARSRDQAGIVYKLAEKMVNLNPELRKAVKPTPSQKMLTGLALNVEFKAISAEAGTAHGLSPVVAILDEVGQVKGPTDSFIEAVETAQGAYDNALLIAISTQAATDADLFSIWLDDAETSKSPKIVSHLYTAPEGCEVMDESAWNTANPALGEFRSLPELRDFAEQASRLSSKENSFRWLYLNQRVEAASPFINRKAWQGCIGELQDIDGAVVYAGLDLSGVNDLTAFVMVAQQSPTMVGESMRWEVHPRFWLPGDGLPEKSRADKVPYDLWHKQGFLLTTPGATVDYEFIAFEMFQACKRINIKKIAFDRWGYRHLRPWLLKAGFTDDQLEGDDAIFVEFGQGFQSMSPALMDLEGAILNKRMVHGGHPILDMCARNAAVQSDPAGNRKLSKLKSHGRIDGMVALAMAISVAATDTDAPDQALTPWDLDPKFRMAS